MQQAIFIDDVPKIRRVHWRTRRRQAASSVEFRVRHPDGSLHWIAAKGRIGHSPALLRGAIFDITERKALEARLLAVNETLEARVGQVREEARALEVLNRTGVAVAAEHDLERLVQLVTDAGVELSHAAFGAFFYNVIKQGGEAYTLYTLSGAPRSAFEKFPMPRNTAIFEPTFRGRGPVRSDDILSDPRYGKSAPYHGMPEGHLPVRSYLAVPVVSRSGEVLGGLFFGHPQPRVFTERAERIVTALASQAAVAIDNARLYQTSQREIAARREAERELQAERDAGATRDRTRPAACGQLTKLEDTERRFRAAGPGGHRLRHLHARSGWPCRQLEPGGGADQRLCQRARSSAALLLLLHAGRPGKRGLPKTRSQPHGEPASTKPRAGGCARMGRKFWASVVINPIKDGKGDWSDLPR